MNNQVYVLETFSFDKIKIGDLVANEVVDYFMDLLPPACMRAGCSQIGEPHTIRIDPDTGKARSTYQTFKKKFGSWPNAVYEYCGDCFLGENEMRGVEPAYVRAGFIA